MHKTKLLKKKEDFSQPDAQHEDSWQEEDFSEPDAQDEESGQEEDLMQPYAQEEVSELEVLFFSDSTCGALS